MGLEKLLTENQKAIVKEWFSRVVDTYPEDTSKFLKKQTDPFANPVGSTTMESLNAVFAELLTPEPDTDALGRAMDPVIRVRAVQSMFKPSQAAGFPYFLKIIIREKFKSKMDDAAFLKELLAFESRIDDTMLTAMNIYMNCREKIITLKQTAEKERMFRTLSRAGLVNEIPEEGPSDLEGQ